MSAIRRVVAIATETYKSDSARRFLVASVASFTVSVGSAVLTRKIPGLAEQYAAALALVIALVFNFFSMRLFVFRSRGHIGREALEYTISSIGFRFAEYLVFLLLFQIAGLPYLMSFIAALGLSFIAKYFFHKNVTFRNKL